MSDPLDSPTSPTNWALKRIAHATEQIAGKLVVLGECFKLLNAQLETLFTLCGAEPKAAPEHSPIDQAPASGEEQEAEPESRVPDPPQTIPPQH
jgi:hypothetical protein